MQYEKSCGAICYLIREDQLKVLLICHVHGKNWSFPKGHVEEGETEQQTALREVFEETGITIDLIPGYREVSRYNPTQGITKDVVYFLGKTDNNQIKLQTEELREAAFVPIAEANKRLAYPADRRMLAKAIDIISKKENIAFK